MNRGLSILLVSVFLLSCAGRPLTGSSDVRMIRDVPFYADSDKQCGPSSLAAVINFWHARRPALAGTSPGEISSEVFSRGARGTLGMDLEFYSRKKGFQAVQYSGSPDDIRRNVANEIPLIILVDYGVSLYQKNHFVVVTGYSSDGIIVHSGEEEKHLSYKELERIWRKTNYWTLSIRPPD